MRAAAKAEAARVRRIHGEVSKALAKVTPIVVSLSELKKDKYVSHLPSFAQYKADAAMKALSSIEKESKQSLANSNPEAPSFDMQHVTEACHEGTAATMLLKQMLDAAKNTSEGLADEPLWLSRLFWRSPKSRHFTGIESESWQGCRLARLVVLASSVSGLKEREEPLGSVGEK